MVRALTIGLLALVALGAHAQPAEYRIGAGDVIAIQVFGQPDLSPRIKVGERGTVAYPFLGDIQVAGRTSREVEQTLLEGLKGPYLVDPRISVTIAEYRPIYVNGEVKQVGGFPWEPGLTVRKAISLAGGLGERASSRKIYLVPENATPGTERQRVDLDHPVAPGDIITVEESFF